MKKWLIIGFLLLLGVTVYVWMQSKQSLFKAPEFVSIDSLNCMEITASQMTFSAVVTMVNNADIQGQLLNTEIKINNNQYTIARVSQTNIQDIQAMSTFNVPITFTVDLINLSMAQGVSGLISAALGEKRSLPVHFSGNTKIKWQGVVIKIPIEVDQNLSW